MRLQELKGFLEVLEHASFSEAALELGVSQSTLSYAVAELERDLGAKLLERGRFGASATELGERLAVYAREMLQLEAAMRQEVGAQQGVIRGRLRVIAFRSVAGRLLPRLMVQLRRRAPELTVRLLEVDHHDDQGRTAGDLLREHRADVAFTERLPADSDDHRDLSGLIVWSLFDDPYVGLVPSDDPRSVLDWSEATILPARGQLGVRLGEQVATHERIQEDSTIVRMVSEGLGSSILPSLAIDDAPAGVKQVPLRRPLSRTIALALLPSVLKVPAVRVFLQTLKTQFPGSDVPDMSVLDSGTTSTPTDEP
ncbi:MAG: LysR family transcriptional regulator [Trueperaceae bacterium]|nr:LysR family transcriptional regulator [Trueperaceae bacterium]